MSTKIDEANTSEIKNMDTYTVLPPSLIPKISSPEIKETTEITKNMKLKIPIAELKS